MFGQNLFEVFPEFGQAIGERIAIAQSPHPGFAHAGHATAKVLEDRKSAAQTAWINAKDFQLILPPLARRDGP